VSFVCPSLCPQIPDACAWTECSGCGAGAKQALTRTILQPEIGTCPAGEQCSIAALVQDRPCVSAPACPPSCPPDEAGMVCGAPVKGTCSTTAGKCVCNPGFGGPACDNSCPSDSLGNVCFGNGSCSEATSFLCQCSPGWTGEACQIPANGSYYTSGLVVGNTNYGGWCVDIGADAQTNSQTSALPLNAFCAVTTENWQPGTEYGCQAGQYTSKTCESLGFASSLSYQGGFAPGVQLYGRRMASSSFARVGRNNLSIRKL
jgi:hypothetical protein